MSQGCNGEQTGSPSIKAHSTVKSRQEASTDEGSESDTDKLMARGSRFSVKLMKLAHWLPSFPHPNYIGI